MSLTQRGPGDVVTPKAGVRVSTQTASGFLPIVRVNQDQSKEGKPGMFRRVDTGEEFEHLQGTPLMIQEGRVLFPQPFQGAGTPPRCWSNDMLVGAAGAEFEGQRCSACPMLFNGCNTNYAVVWLQLPSNEEFLLQLTSGMMRAVGELIQKDTVRERHVRIGTQKVRGRTGNWYTLKIEEDMPELAAEQKINIERYFRDRHLGEKGQVLAPTNDHDDLDSRDAGDATRLAAMAEIVAPTGVDPATGEILDFPKATQEDAALLKGESPPDDDYDDLPF